MNDKLTLELDRDEATLLLSVLRKGFKLGSGDFEQDDEDRILDIRDAILDFFAADKGQEDRPDFFVSAYEWDQAQKRKMEGLDKGDEEE